MSINIMGGGRGGGVGGEEMAYLAVKWDNNNFYCWSLPSN